VQNTDRKQNPYKKEKTKMKRPSLKKLRTLIGGKGLYIGAAACIIAAGGAGAAAYNRAVKEIDHGLSYTAPKISDSSGAGIFADEKKDNVPKEILKPETSEESSRPDSEGDKKAAETVPVAHPNVMPVNGEIIEPFSFGELVRSETLGVWKTHDGVDIKADKNTPVKAMNRGEVTKIWDDPLWGSCATIDHGNGLVGYYYNLSHSLTVEEGDTVEAGQVIGMVGDTAQIEVSLPSHLHFGLKRNGKWIDPVGFIDPFFTK